MLGLVAKATFSLIVKFMLHMVLLKSTLLFHQSCLTAAFNFQGLGAGFGNGTPASRSLSLLAMPMSQAAVPRFLPHTNPTAANISIISLLGLN